MNPEEMEEYAKELEDEEAAAVEEQRCQNRKTMQKHIKEINELSRDNPNRKRIAELLKEIERLWW